ncbi:MAG: aminodeoxychorismate synthase component I [Spirochaetales bacterium]|nr:aminodeoxychorismate synthase component I [Spirochaetales bacterium]
MWEKLNEFGRQRRPCFFVVDFSGKEPFVCDLDRCADEGILFSIPARGNAGEPRPMDKPFSFVKRPVSFETYARAFSLVRDELRRGNTYLVNLTFPTPVETNLRLEEIFLHSRALYKLLFRERFVVFSPEEFVSVRGNRIATRPMKGTIDATLTDAGERLLGDPKELAEHITVVDLLRNDLGRVARRIAVDRFRYIDEVVTHEGRLLQASTEISGELDDAWPDRLGDLLRALLPAGSVTGAPKKRTVEIIRSVEAYDRGYYTGVFGVFDGRDLASGVMIRFIERDAAGGLVFKSGGGITMDSDPAAEYREMVDKVYVPIAGDDYN